MEALFPPIWPFTAPLAKTILLIVRTNTLQTSQVYYNLVPFRFWMLHTCDFCAPYLKSLLKLFSSASFSLPPPPFPSQSQPRGPRFPWIPKSERKKVTFKWKTSNRARDGRFSSRGKITFSGWFLLMTASSMFFPPDWTTWERTDGVSSQPNSPLTSHTFMVSNSSPASPQGLYWEPNVVFLDFSQTFIYVGCLVICLSSHMKGYFRNRNAF